MGARKLTPPMSRSPAGVVVLAICTLAVTLASCGSVQVTEPVAMDPVRSDSAPNTVNAPSPNQVTVGQVPEHLLIPAIQVSTAVVRLGLNPNRTVEVPSNPAKAGWFDQGPAPGQLGSAVILGHVDSKRGPAIFYRLRALRPGNRVEVRLSDGAVAHFAVARVVTYANRQFPARRVYAGDPRRRGLTLVTCGGAYDPNAGGYQSNVVVYTRFLRTRGPQ